MLGSYTRRTQYESLVYGPSCTHSWNPTKLRHLSETVLCRESDTITFISLYQNYKADTKYITFKRIRTSQEQKDGSLWPLITAPMMGITIYSLVLG